MTHEDDESGREPGRSWDDDERARRQRALAELAQQRLRAGADTASLEAKPSTPERVVLAPHRGRRHTGRWLSLAAAALLLVAVVAVAALHVRTQLPAAPTQAQVIPQLGRYFCVNDAAWSPDDKTVALLADDAECNNQDQNTLSELALLDAASGKIVHRILLDAPIRQLLDAMHFPTPVPGASIPPPSMRYENVLWSRDGSRLAVPFVAGYALAPTQFMGVLLADASGGSVHILLRPQGGLVTDGIWDLTAGKLVPLPPNAPKYDPNDPSGFEPPDLGGPALAFQWQPNGTLRPVMPLTTAPAAPLTSIEPVGNPSGGASFTIFQPGQAYINVQATQGGPVYLPGVASFETNFSAWSPDGRYLLTYALAWVHLSDAKYDRLSPAGQQTLAGTFPLAPMHDRAFQSLLDSAQLTQQQPNSPNYYVAWSPDGRRLAVTANSATGEGQPDIYNSITIYDCASGRTLARLKPVNAPISTQPILSWSPDGSHLLFYDGVLTLFGPGALPR